MRLLYRFRLRPWIVNLRCCGPVLEFWTSAKMRDFHALLLLILVLGTSLSGLLVHVHVELTADKDHHSGGRDIYELGWSYVLLDTASALSTVLGMLGLILMLVMSHIL